MRRLVAVEQALAAAVQVIQDDNGASVILRYSEGSGREREGPLAPARSFGVPQDDRRMRFYFFMRSTGVPNHSAGTL